MFKQQARSQSKWGFQRFVIPFMIACLLLLGFIIIPSSNFDSHAETSGVALVPLADMDSDSTYYGYPGGLYPDGTNTIPASHSDDGIALSKQVLPRNEAGQISGSGKILFLSIGMSNTNMEFEEFRKAASNDSSLNPSLLVVNGAEGGMTAARIQNPLDNASGTQYWTYVDQKLSQAGATRMQVQAAWLKEADSSPTGSPIIYAQKLA